MDVKSAFLNGKLKEEVYAKQPHGFESSEFPDYVYKLDKALYGLKQAPREWYETLFTFLIQNKFARGIIDNISFIYKSKGDVLLAQLYQSNPKESHLTAVKRILRYLKGSCQILSGKLVCWSAKKQQSVAMSLTKAEYLTAAGCFGSIIWMKSQLSDYDIHYKMAPIFCDNTNAIAISNNPVLSRNYSSTELVNSIQQLLAYNLITGTEVDIGEIIYNDFVTKLLSKSRLKYVSYPRFVSCALQVLPGPDYTQDKKFRFLPLLGIKCTRHSHCQVKCSHWQYKFPLPVKVVATAKRLEMPRSLHCY
nr:retrovirus-related Pol polyprotein from transposon TNT 1-94 [Tanacetum cinerariifolium]